MATEIVKVWAPQEGPQEALIHCPYKEIFFGGARGGGKSNGILGKFGLKAERYGAGFNGVFFRKEMPQQDDLIADAKEIYEPIGAEWKEQKKTFIFKHGGRLRFRALENIKDAEKYQGQNISDAAVEEAGNYEQSDPIDRLFGCLRSKTGVPTQLVLTANPGGAGHQWIKARYIDPAPLGMKPLVRKLPNGKDHTYIFIPSKLSDNKILTANDPDYDSNLYLVGTPELVRAWLLGDWTVVQGAYFSEWSLKNVIKPMELPPHLTKMMAFDWGSNDPFSIGWYAIADGSFSVKSANGQEWTPPRGSMIKYREWYGASAPNKGLKLFIEQVADGILNRENPGEVTYRVAGRDLFDRRGGESLAERMALKNLIFQPADTTRIPGWDKMRRLLIGSDGKPMLYFFSTCIDSIRTIPSLQHDDKNANDVAQGEDHAADECRYALMSRPDVTDTPVTIQDLVAKQYESLKVKPTLDDLFRLERPEIRR